MDKLIENAKKELAQIEEKGFCKENLELTGTFLNIIKEANQIKAMEEVSVTEATCTNEICNAMSSGCTWG